MKKRINFGNIRFNDLLSIFPPRFCIIIYLCTDNKALASSHRGCSNDKIRPTLVLRPSIILSLLLFRQF